MQGEIEILQVEKKIRTRVKKQMEKTQKEYYLNEQMQAIQKELGERDEFKTELQEPRREDQVEEDVEGGGRQRVKKELRKLKMMSPMSAEATVVRNYIDWIISLPWYDYTKDKHDIVEAETILNEDHYGLMKVKDRILEYLAVQALVKKKAEGGRSFASSALPASANLSGQEHRQGALAQVRPHLAWRRARRGGNSRTPPHLYRRDARQDHPVDEEGGLGQSGLFARRDRQDVDRLPRRSLVGAARSTRP